MPCQSEGRLKKSESRVVWCSEPEWNDALEQRAAEEEEARQLQEERAQEEAEAAELARIEREKRDVCASGLLRRPLMQ